MTDFTPLYSPLAARGFAPQPPLAEQPMRYNFGQGLAALETFPMSAFKDIMNRVVDQYGPPLFEYFDPRNSGADDMAYGDLGLRRELLRMLEKRDGRKLSPDEIAVTSGSVHALALAVMAYLGPGDGAVVEETTFRCPLHAMRCAGSEVASVPVDDDGLVIEAVERQFEQFRAKGIRPKMIYTIPTFNLPTGACLSLPRRRALIELAKKWDVVILEDNVYGHLRYDGDTLPTLLAMDNNGDDSGRVIQTESFSKTIAPGLRVGWVAGSRAALAPIISLRTSQDFGISQFLARVMTLFLAEGRFEPHVAAANAVYKRKRDIAVAAMEEHCGRWVRFKRPLGSFYLWIELKPELDWEGVRVNAVKEGVFCRPGESFTTGGSHKHYLRLAFSHSSEDEIRGGIEILGRVMAAHARQSA